MIVHTPAMARSMRTTIEAIFGISLVAAALYLTITTALDYEGNFLLFVWRAFAPTTAIALCGYGVLCLLVRILRPRIRSYYSRIVFGALLVAAIAPIAREVRQLRTAPHVAIAAPLSFTLFDMNLLGHRDVTPRVIPEIRTRNPDIVLLQEVTPEIAAKLQSELGNVYPCQITDPRPGSYGMATLVRHPCEKLAFKSSGYWVGHPQITKVTLPNDRTVLAVNLHGIHPHALIDVAGDEGIVGELNNTVAAREGAIAGLLGYLTQFHNTPLVMGGDLNATMRNRVYALIRNAGYRDSWLSTHSLVKSVFEGGTWPFPEKGIPSFLAWILRIDFVFYSEQLKPASVEVLPASLGSDHRGLLVRFAE
jgi:endonuclease/exonuclease/phosphatase (EEP) superfamily protein YafD